MNVTFKPNGGRGGGGRVDECGHLRRERYGAGVQDPGERLDAVDETRTRPHERGVGVDGPHRKVVGQVPGGDHVGRQAGGPVEIVTARRHHDEVAALAATSAQVVAADRAPDVPSAATPPAAATMSGIQCPAVNGGSVHSTTATRGRGPAGHGGSARRRDGPAATRRGRGGVGTPGRGADGLDAGQHLVEGPGSMVRTSAVQPRCASAASDVAHVDGAHRAEILGEDEMRVELPQRAFVQVIEVVARREPLADVAVDLPRAQALRSQAASRRSSSSAPRAGSRTPR